MPSARAPELVRPGLPETLERFGRPVAYTRRPAYAGLQLAEYLRAERNVDLLRLPRRLAVIAGDVGEDQDIELLLLTDGHRRRYAERLARLDLKPGDLKRYYDAHNSQTAPEVGASMVEWLGLIRDALATVAPGRIVVVPVLD